MRVIAFDLGSSLAAAHNLGPAPAVRLLEAEGIREHRAGESLIWLHRLFRELKNHKGFSAPEAVIYEQPFARGEHATRALWGLAGLIEATATNATLAVLSVPPTTIKKFITGDARASKEQMIEAAQMLGYAGNNEHEADAWCLLHYAECNLEKGVQ